MSINTDVVINVNKVKDKRVLTGGTGKNALIAPINDKKLS